MAPTITVDGDEIIDASIDGDAVEEITIDGALAWAAAVGLDGLTVTRQDGSYTASSGEHVVSNGGTITLPSPVQDGVVMVTEVQTRPQLTGTVDGITDPYISGDDSVVFVSEGSAWYSVDRNQISAIPDAVITQYEFEDDTDSSVAIDSVGSNNADINGASFDADSYKGDFALLHDGTSNTQSQSDINLAADGTANEMSIAAFFKPDGNNTGSFSWSLQWGINGNNEFSISLSNDGSYWEAFLQVSDSNTFATGNTAADSSTYQHVAATVDNSEIVLYVDGSVDASQTHSDDLSTFGSGTMSTGARVSNEESGSYTGLIDNPTFANEKLTQEDIQSLL